MLNFELKSKAGDFTSAGRLGPVEIDDKTEIP